MWNSGTWWWITFLWLLWSVKMRIFKKKKILFILFDSTRAYHMDCLNPPLNEPPPGAWYCQLCTWMNSKIPNVIEILLNKTKHLLFSDFYVCVCVFSSTSSFTLYVCDNNVWYRCFYPVLILDSCWCVVCFLLLICQIEYNFVSCF
jgi:hypothetical protein